MAKGPASKALEEIKRIQNDPGFVYMIRNKDLYKIGITVSFERRMKQLKPDEVIAVKEASNIRGIERLLHARYKHARIPQSEYFRLDENEIEEAIFLLEGDDELEGSTAVYEASKESKKAQKLIAKEGAKKVRRKIDPDVKEVLGDVQQWLFDYMGGEALWKEGPITDEGKVVARTSYIGFVLACDNQPGISSDFPKTPEVDNAAERLLIREEIFMNVAKAETPEAARVAANQLMIDVCLLICWGYRKGDVRVTIPEDPDAVPGMIASMEDLLKAAGIWYTTSPAKSFGSSLFWVLVLACIVISFALPPLGLAGLALAVVFRGKLTSR